VWKKRIRKLKNQNSDGKLDIQMKTEYKSPSFILYKISSEGIKHFKVRAQILKPLKETQEKHFKIWA
jgi:cephalosporin-C deacetylase-like acetyl esterase